MGLAADFKSYVRSHLPDAIVDAQHADINVVDAMCSLRGFAPDNDPNLLTRPLDQLAARIVDVAYSSAAHGCTLLVVFDRQRSTTQMKAIEQAARNTKRKKPDAEKKKWTAEETDALILRRELPCGSEWNDFLDDREVRGRVVQAISEALFVRFRERSGVMDRVSRLVVVNGRVGADSERGYGPRAQTADRANEECRDVDVDEDPWTGEADVAMARWVRILLHEHRGAPVDPPRVAVFTVDTDLVPIFMIHGGNNCIVYLSAPQPQHRMAIGAHALASAISKAYGLRPDEAVVCAILKKTDFTKPCLKGLPDWDKTMRLCGDHLKRTRGDVALVSEGVLNVQAFKRMIESVAFAASAKRKVVAASLKADDEKRLRFVTKYWLRLEAE